jgi:hypothetical protein
MAWAMDYHFTEISKPNVRRLTPPPFLMSLYLGTDLFFNRLGCVGKAVLLSRNITELIYISSRKKLCKKQAEKWGRRRISEGLENLGVDEEAVGGPGSGLDGKRQ